MLIAETEKYCSPKTDILHITFLACRRHVIKKAELYGDEISPLSKMMQTYKCVKYNNLRKSVHNYLFQQRFFFYVRNIPHHNVTEIILVYIDNYFLFFCKQKIKLLAIKICNINLNNRHMTFKLILSITNVCSSNAFQ